MRHIEYLLCQPKYMKFKNRQNECMVIELRLIVTLREEMSGKWNKEDFGDVLSVLYLDLNRGS